MQKEDLGTCKRWQRCGRCLEYRAQGKLPLTELPLLGSTKDLLNGGLWMRNLQRKKMKHMATGEVGEEMQMA